jgi:short-subunit dehydrogenase
VARREQALAAVADAIAASGRPRPTVLPVDVARAGAAHDIAAALAARDLEPETVVNNAGFGLIGAASTLDRAEQLAMIDLNVRALTDFSLAFLDSLERRQGGILNVASVAGFLPGPGMAVYYATKAYVVSFTEAIAEEFASGGVHVTAFCPGPVETEFARIAGNDDSVLFKLGAAKADAVAQDAYRTFMKRRVLVIAGATNWLGVQLLRVSPRALVRKVAAWVNSRGDSDGSAGGGSGPRPRRDGGPGATAPSRRGPKPEEPHANSARS